MQINVKTDRLPQEILLRLLPLREGQNVLFESEKQLIINDEAFHKEILEFLLEKAVIHELTAGEGKGITIFVRGFEKNTSSEVTEAEEVKEVEENPAETKTEVAEAEEVKVVEENPAETKTEVAEAEEVKEVEENPAETKTEVAEAEEVKEVEENPAETKTEVVEAEEVKEVEENSTETKTEVAEAEEVKVVEEKLAEVEKKVDTNSKKNGERASKKKVSIDRGTFDISVFDEFSKGKDKKTFLKNLAEEYLGQKNDERKETFAEGILKVLNTEDVKSFVSTTEWDLALRSNITYHLKKHDVSLKNFVEELVAYIKVKYNESTENSVSLKETNKDENENSVSFETEAKPKSVNELIVKSFDMPKEDFQKLSIDDRVKHIFDKMLKDISIEKFEKANILSMFQHAMKRRNISNFDCIYLDNIVEGVEQLERNRAEMLCATIIESFCGRMIKVVDFWKILQSELLSNKELEALKK